MKPTGIITMTTDFGYRDPFVGQMKGSLLSIHPSSVIVDLTHDIPSHDVAEAAYVLAESYSWFPPGTIHLCVVDPGVGSPRRAIILFSGDHFFIGPDNGCLSGVIERNKHYRAVHITNGRYVRTSTGPTFHGRDIFAPAAAWLARGVDLAAFGPPIEDVHFSAAFQMEVEGNCIAGRVIYVDTFGNAITNVRQEAVDGVRRSVCRVLWNGVTISMTPYYGAASGQDLHALFNSSGYLELFVNQKSAAALHGIRKGDKVIAALSPLPNISSADT